ncbi:MAG: hypothetical protein ACI8RZ_001458 [Myxococcota bacterium]|jgi:hypothetical protein
MSQTFLPTDRLWLGEEPSPAEFVDNPAYHPEATLGYPDAYRERLVIDAIHGGDVIPPHLQSSLGQGAPLGDCAEFQEAYVREKDWGATQVAESLATRLGLSGFFRVNIARGLMDFGRFPGESAPGAAHLERFAISDYSAAWLTHDEKRTLLQSYFDNISDQIESKVTGCLLKIAIHTYDKLSRSGTVRPEVSLIFRPQHYQNEGRMPVGVFDRMFPDRLAEFTADRRLISRISLELEKRGIAVAYNYPYLMPEGSVEFRAQVWFFFDYLRQRFNAANPELVTAPAYGRIWEMLLDTNLRSARSAALRSYLHLFRTVLPHQEPLYRRSRDAYNHIQAFLFEHDIAEDYRKDAQRPGALAIEVRKDLVWNFHDDACREPVLGAEGARTENIDRITGELARAIRIYLCEDRRPVARRMD